MLCHDHVITILMALKIWQATLRPMYNWYWHLEIQISTDLLLILISLSSLLLFGRAPPMEPSISLKPVSLVQKGWLGIASPWLHPLDGAIPLHIRAHPDQGLSHHQDVITSGWYSNLGCNSFQFGHTVGSATLSPYQLDLDQMISSRYHELSGSACWLS